MLLAAASAWPTMRRLDDAAVARPREVSLLRSIPMFAPLGVPAIEQLAAAMVPVHAHTGSAVVRQGDPGDHFYIITGGRVAVSIDGRQVREEGPGESFGEIALLRNVPRTATVVALESTQLISLDRTTFLEAVTGLPASAAAAEATVARHLGAAVAEPTPAEDRRRCARVTWASSSGSCRPAA